MIKNQTLLFLTGILGLVLFFSFHSAYASSISIEQPFVDQIIHTNSTTISGSFVEQGNTTWARVTGNTLTYSLYVYIDGQQYSPTITNGNHFSLYVNDLNNGAHNLEAEIIDNSGDAATDYGRFITIYGHFSISRLHIGLIEYSQTCQDLLSHNITSICPTLDKLAPFDTTNQTYAGKIIKLPNGQWARTKPMIKQFWRFFQSYNKNIWCVECDFEFQYAAAVPIIWIEPHGFTYAQVNSTYENRTETYWNGTQYLTRIINEPVQGTSNLISWDSYISPDCMSANEVFSPNLLADTIYYIDSNCAHNALKIFNTKILVIPKAPIDYSTVWELKEEAYVQAAPASHNCVIHSCDLGPNPTDNAAFYTIPNPPKQNR